MFEASFGVAQRKQNKNTVIIIIESTGSRKSFKSFVIFQCQISRSITSLRTKRSPQNWKFLIKISSHRWVVYYIRSLLLPHWGSYVSVKKKKIEILVSEYSEESKTSRNVIFSWRPGVCACVSNFQRFKPR